MPRWDGVLDPVGEIQALKRQDYRELAQDMLEKVYRYVLPIMRKHRYRVHKLVEFLPKNPNLLGVNVNHGQRISLRLRYHHNPREFLPFESVLGTMLHELCHNTHGPHDANFFRLLDELTKEMEDLMAKGFRGDPFLGSGRTLGQPIGGSFRRTPYSGPLGTMGAGTTRSAPRGAARGAKLGAGKKLGGLGVSNRERLSLRDRVLRAAERRQQADTSCKTAKNMGDLSPDEKEEVIDLTKDFDDDGGNSAPMKGPDLQTEVISLIDSDD